MKNIFIILFAILLSSCAGPAGPIPHKKQYETAEIRFRGAGSNVFEIEITSHISGIVEIGDELGGFKIVGYEPRQETKLVDGKEYRIDTSVLLLEKNGRKFRLKKGEQTEVKMITQQGTAR